jgi:hypothetical protein
VVFNLGDCAERLGLSLVLKEKQAWWKHSTTPNRVKVVPRFLSAIAASTAESQL